MLIMKISDLIIALQQLDPDLDVSATVRMGGTTIIKVYECCELKSRAAKAQKSALEGEQRLKRNAEIIRCVQSGATLKEVAVRFGLSAPRVRQLVCKYLGADWRNTLATDVVSLRARNFRHNMGDSLRAFHKTKRKW